MGSAKVIVSALAVQTESMKGEWRRMAEQRLEADQAQNTRWQQNFEQVSQGVIDLTKVVAAVLHNGNEHHTTAQKSLEHLIGIAHSSDQTQAALRQFTESNQDNLAALQKAGTTMGDAALKVSESAGDLQVVVNDLSKQMTEVLNGVKDGLNDTLETMNDDFSENLHKMGSDLEGATDKLSVVMNDVNKSLGTTIRSMSEDLKENLSSMSTNLQKATDNISTSIDSMSESVNAAMNEVAKNMKSTANIQIESSEEFKDISGSLNASVIAMTSMVEKVTKDIKLSLTAVSQSGQRMADLDSRYANVSTMLEQIPDTLKALAAAPERPVPDLKPLQTSLDQLNHAAENIRDALSARQEVEA